MNTDILNEEVRCIAPDGEQLGVMKTEDAIAEADSHGLDLVEVSPNADPPVCKILDYGKFKFEFNFGIIVARFRNLFRRIACLHARNHSPGFRLAVILAHNKCAVSLVNLL